MSIIEGEKKRSKTKDFNAQVSNHDELGHMNRIDLNLIKTEIILLVWVSNKNIRGAYH